MQQHADSHTHRHTDTQTDACEHASGSVLEGEGGGGVEKGERGERGEREDRERERRHTLPHFRIYIGLLTHETMYKQEDVSVCLRAHTH